MTYIKISNNKLKNYILEKKGIYVIINNYIITNNKYIVITYQLPKMKTQKNIYFLLDDVRKYLLKNKIINMMK